MSLDALSPSHWHPVDWSIVGPALVAGLLVLSTHVPLGQRVLRKGIVFIDLAIAQIAGLGVIAAGTLGWSEQVWAVQGAAVGAALLGAVLLTWMERRWPDIQEALIGALFVLASSVGILLLAGNPHGGEHLKDLLVGQILWVTPDQLWGVAALSAAVLAVWFGAQRWLGQAGFYLVFSSLIMPALAVRQAPVRWQLPLAWGSGALAYTVGLCVSAMFDWPSGAVVVVAMALVSTILGGVVACWPHPDPEQV